jgi:hypothetical protein
MPSSRPGSTLNAVDDARFALDAQNVPVPSPALAEGMVISPREHELARKLHELLASPLGEGVALIVEESYRLLPLIR